MISDLFHVLSDAMRGSALIAAGADMKAKNKDGKTPLKMASIDMTRKLLLKHRRENSFFYKIFRISKIEERKRLIGLNGFLSKL